MPINPIDLGPMTDEEIGELGTRCLGSLSLAERVQSVLRAFLDIEEREELISHLEEANAEPEDED
jgi:hypothetical protein